MKKFVLAAMSIAGFICTSTAFADDHAWYVSIALGDASGSGTRLTMDQATVGAGAGGFSSKIGLPTVYKLHGGYQINKNWAIEGGYLGSNNQTYSASGGNLVGTTTTSTSINGWSLAAVGTLPIVNNFSILGKLGVASMQQSTDPETTLFLNTASVTYVSGHKTDVTYGVGVKYDFPKDIFARLDVDSYNVGNSTYANRIAIWTIDLGYKF